LALFLRQGIPFIGNTKEIEPRFSIFDAENSNSNSNTTDGKIPLFHSFPGGSMGILIVTGESHERFGRSAAKHWAGGISPEGALDSSPGHTSLF
jgi:hypothetical protein